MGNSRMSRIGKDVVYVRVPLHSLAIHIESPKMRVYDTDAGRFLVVVTPTTPLPAIRISNMDLAVVDLGSLNPSVGYLKKGHTSGNFYTTSRAKTSVVAQEIRKWTKEYLMFNGAVEYDLVYIAPLDVGRVLIKLGKLGHDGYTLIKSLKPQTTPKELEQVIDVTRKILV